MTLFMDIHTVGPEMTAQDIADAHMLDMHLQAKHGVAFHTYWHNEQSGHLFCLLEAPSVEAANAVHSEGSGLVADVVIPVEQGSVAAMLGNGTAMPVVPQPVDEPGPERDRAVRTILFTDLQGSVEITQRLGDERAMALLRVHDAIIREALRAHAGNEVKHTGDGIMASFLSASNAVGAAVAIQRALAEHNADAANEPLRVRIGLAAGEPVAEGGDLFGSVVQLAARICDSADAGQILVAGVVRELSIGKGHGFDDRGAAELKGFEAPVQLFEVPWR
ncbi:MAG: nickel-binding protein [Dehalococcoidia bacterium]